MIRSELVELLSSKSPHLSSMDVEETVKLLFEIMAGALADQRRIEIRGFGSFSVQRLRARQGRNPKTGETIPVDSRIKMRFKPGKELSNRVNDNRLQVIRK